MQQVAEQGKSQKTVSNGRAVRRFLLSATAVEMNPLAIFRGLGKLLDAILRDRSTNR